MIGLLALTLAATATARQPLLQPLSSLAGHCWRGSAPGNAGIDTHCFAWVYGGQHLRDRHVVTVAEKPVYEGETLYSAENGRVTFTYWNSLGGIGRGEMAASGDALTFTGTIHATPASQEQALATSWRKSERSYEVTDPGEQPRLFKRVD
jgi:hypothetical protein